MPAPSDCDRHPKCGGSLRVRRQRVRPSPSAVVVHSGSGGAYLYWSLREPLEVAELESANRRHADLLGADPSSADAARSLRPPFTLNYKVSPPRPVRLEPLHPERAYAPEQIIGKLSPPLPWLLPAPTGDTDCASTPTTPSPPSPARLLRGPPRHGRREDRPFSSSAEGYARE